MPFLTILTIIPHELDDSYLEHYRDALLNWNKEGLADAQVILLPQGKSLPQSSFPFEILSCEFESVDGYPIWDVMKQIRTAWKSIRGDYVTVDHPEFIWGPERLERTINWLRGYRPIYALGNLRRDGCWEQITQLNCREISRDPSLWFKRFLEEGRWEEAITPFECMSTIQWMYWRGPPQRPGTNEWIEEVFYADRQWLEAWGFISHGGEMPFQDVWDLLQVATKIQRIYGLPFDCHRMPMNINKIRHLWHPRLRSNLTPAVRDWFLSQPERWAKSSFGNADLWRDLLLVGKNNGEGNNSVHELRFGPRGTAANYRAAVAAWLDNGGVEKMQQFYLERNERELR